MGDDALDVLPAAFALVAMATGQAADEPRPVLSGHGIRRPRSMQRHERRLKGTAHAPLRQAEDHGEAEEHEDGCGAGGPRDDAAERISHLRIPKGPKCRRRGRASA